MTENVDNTEPSSKKTMPWLKVMAGIAVLMVIGAVVVQSLKAKKAAELDRARKELLEKQLKKDIQQALKESEIALQASKLTEAERQLKLVQGLDVEGEYADKLEPLKLEYNKLKAHADKEAVEVKKRDRQASQLIDELERVAKSSDIEAQSSLIDAKVRAFDKLKTAGLSESTEARFEKVDRVLNAKLRKENIQHLASLNQDLSTLQTRESIDRVLTEIKERSAREGVPIDYLTKSKRSIEQLERKLNLIDAEKVFKASLNDEKWDQAEQILSVMRSLGIVEAQANQYRTQLDASRKQAELRNERVKGLLEEIKSMDTSHYNALAMDLVEQILSESPHSKEALAYKDKLKEYLKVIRVPGDVSSLDEAVKLAPVEGRVILGEGVFYVEISTDKALRIEGQGADKTILESSAKASPAIHFTHKTGIARLSNLQIAGQQYSSDEERNALVVIAGDAHMEDCEVVKSPGHGVLVLSGKLEMKRCRSAFNGWDGLSVKGKNSQAVATDCLFEENSEHGVDFWDGSSGTIYRSKVTASSGSGIVLTGKSRATIAQTTSQKNGEAGIHIASGSIAKLDKVVSSSNGLSGVAIQDADTSVIMDVVSSSENGQAGYFVDSASKVQGLEAVTGEGNKEGKVTRRRPQ